MRILKALGLTALVASVLLTAAQAAGVGPPSPPADLPGLEPGRALERKMAGGESQTYQISLKEGSFLHVVVERGGIAVVVTVIGPDGTKVASVNSPREGEASKSLQMVAPATGTYRLEVAAPDKKAESGQYRVKIEELLTAEQYRQRLAEQARQIDEAKKWLAGNAIVLKGVEAGQGFKDLEPLKKVIGSAHIVSLGEATHGTREFFQLKHRMLEFLVSEMDFTIFAIEASMPEAFDINEYVLTGRGDPAKALAGLHFWTWDTEEVLDMIRWMRAYNADPRHVKKVKFYGFDMQYSPRAARVALDYLGEVDPASSAGFEKKLAVLANPFLAQEARGLPVEKQKELAAASQALLKNFDDRKEDYIQRTSATKWAVARQHARVLGQFCESSVVRADLPKALSMRDSAMAENVSWILGNEGPSAKVVLWAHNGHVETSETATFGDATFEWKRMGLHLRKKFGAEMVVFGFAFNRGGFQSMDFAETGKGLRSFDIGPAPVGSFDAVLASSNLPLAAWDLRTLPKDGPVAKWFAEPRATRSIGAGYVEGDEEQILVKQKAQALYDVMLFVEKTTSARPNKTGVRSFEDKPNATPANLGFEDGKVGQLPSGWSGPEGLAAQNYETVTIADEAHTGKQCAMIRSTPGPRYGDPFGNVTQVIDATPFRGQKVRLRAAVRTDVAGVGNQAHLWLDVYAKTSGPAVSLDGPAAQPITTRTWKVIEIVQEVPKDAETISFGLALVGEGRAWLDSVSVEAVTK